MKVLTAAQMREIDRKTIELGISGLVLMENAGHRVIEVLEEKFSPLSGHRILVLCGNGNNGGDGFVVARQLHTRFHPERLDVVFAGEAEKLKGDAATNFKMLEACGCPVHDAISEEMRGATIVIDALLGTGLSGPARGPMLELIREINTGFPRATVVAVDIPSGLASDTGARLGEAVEADLSVTFTAPKIGQVLPPNCDAVGDLHIGTIGSPPELFENDPGISLSLSGPRLFRHLVAARAPGGHKGTYGHALVVGGSRGKTGAAAMAGIAALRAGAGLVTVAAAESAIPVIASHAPEMMTESLPETEIGSISPKAFDFERMASIMDGKTVIAIGPGLGSQSETAGFAQRLVRDSDRPLIIDADGLNVIAGTAFPGRPNMVLTPHPGEMARLAGISRDEVLRDRIGVARSFAAEKDLILVLKGQRTLIATPDGWVWINTTGTPAMATGGTGDVLTGLIAGLAAQFPDEIEQCVLAAVWLHGQAGELGAEDLGEQPLLATDLLDYLPEAIRDCADFPD